MEKGTIQQQQAQQKVISQRSQQALWYSHTTCILLLVQPWSSSCMEEIPLNPLHKIMKNYTVVLWMRTKELL